MATTKRSDATTLPSGSSMRTGPCTTPGRWVSPAPREDPKRSRLVGPDHEQLLRAPAGIETIGLFQPPGARCQHRPRTESIATRRLRRPVRHRTARQGCAAGRRIPTVTSRRLPRSASRSGTAWQSGSSTSRPSYPAFHARAGPIAAGSALLTPGSCGTYGGLHTTRSNGANSTARAHDPRCTSTSTPAHTAFTRAHRTARGQISNAVTAEAPCCSGGDRHHTAAGAQIGDPAPNGQPGLLQNIDDHPGVVLGPVHALCRDHNVALVGVFG